MKEDIKEKEGGVRLSLTVAKKTGAVDGKEREQKGGKCWAKAGRLE